MMIDYDGSVPTRKKVEIGNKESDGRVVNALSSTDSVSANQNKDADNQENDDVFSDSEGEETMSSKSSQARATSGALTSTHTQSGEVVKEVKDVTHQTQRLSISKEATRSSDSSETKTDGVGRLGLEGMSSDIKAIAADASVFTFGDDEDFESE